MKKLFILISLSFSIASSARSWYIKPHLGIGRSFNSELMDRPASITFYKGELATGIEFSRLRVETGLGYVNPGFKIVGFMGASKYVNLHYRFGYLYLPIRVAYQIDLSQRLSVVPAVGIAPSYNTRAKLTMTTAGEPDQTNDVLNVKKMGAFADASVFLEYRIGAFSAIAGISYKHMISNIVNGGSRFYLLSADAGILYRF
ncbi:hypothetical protein [Polluticoccus soli]|uniref:hypothetical protein n=1 Tax=Polluticoccus soli TaxID=3034150 RepID=UPI0023E19CA7|nr:hypothetical protein [Flavipsychrobacter sp. JY13-12]